MKYKLNIDRKKSMQKLDQETLSFLEFARDQGAFDWQTGDYQSADILA